MSLYEIHRLRKSFGAREVLNIPELTIERGRIYALLGANGSGKTTLLKLLAFLDVPTEGEMLFEAARVHFEEKRLRKLRGKVLMLDQHPILFSTTVFKNLEFGLKIRKVAAPERRRRIDEALESVGMTKFRDAQAPNLSGGETQRVALARVLVLKPQVLLFDEPTSNVDRANQQIIIELLRELNEKQNISIIFSTHDPSLSTSLAHHTICLDQGAQGVVGVNVFQATLLPGQNPSVGRLSCGTELILPHPPKGSTFLVRVKPIYLEGGATRGNSEKCVIQGVIQKIYLESDQIHLDIKAGSLFSFQLTADQYRGGDFTVGRKIALHIPPDAVEILEE